MKLIHLDVDVQPIIDKAKDCGFRCRGVHIDGENRRRALTLVFELPPDDESESIRMKEERAVHP